MTIPITKKAKAFMKANDLLPVVEGTAKGNGGQGGIYWLEDRQRFDLSLEDFQSLPEGYPKWPWDFEAKT